MRQISFPLVLLEYNFFILKSEFLQARIILEYQEIGRSLIENENDTSGSALTTTPNYVPTNKTMEKPPVASE